MESAPLSGQSYRFAPDLSLIDGVRTAFCQFLEQAGLPDRLIEGWRLVFSEVVTNAIQHGCSGDPADRVSTAWWLAGDRVVLEVADPGPGPDPARVVDPELPEDALQGHGRGLFLIHQFVDEWEHWRGEPGYRARLSRTESAVDRRSETERLLDQALEEISLCYESLAAFYRLGDALIQSSSVARFIHQALVDLVQVVQQDLLAMRFLPHLNASLLEELEAIEIAVDWPIDEGAFNRCVETGQEFIWEQADEVAGQPRLERYASGIVTPIKAGDRLIGLLVLARLPGNPYLNAAELNTVRTFGDLFGIAVTNADHAISRDREAQALRELEIAANLQETLVPTESPEEEEDRARLVIRRKSAREVSGDYAEAFYAANGDLLLVMVDVMGKGVSAAFLAAMVRTALRILMDSHAQVGVLVDAMNQILCRLLGELTLFATCAIVRVSADRKHLQIVNAGHCPVLLLDGDHRIVEEWMPGGPPLGLFEEQTYEQATHTMADGEALVLVTDGVYEWEHDGSVWGWPAFKAYLESHLDAGPEAFWDAFIAHITDQTSDREIADDQTFLYWGTTT
ncbi:MAG: SpoIIE family protein phosphatase [Opitutales bacterium]